MLCFSVYLFFSTRGLASELSEGGAGLLCFHLFSIVSVVLYLTPLFFCVLLFHLSISPWTPYCVLPYFLSFFLSRSLCCSLLLCFLNVIKTLWTDLSTTSTQLFTPPSTGSLDWPYVDTRLLSGSVLRLHSSFLVSLTEHQLELSDLALPGNLSILSFVFLIPGKGDDAWSSNHLLLVNLVSLEVSSPVLLRSFFSFLTWWSDSTATSLLSPVPHLIRF